MKNMLIISGVITLMYACSDGDKKEAENKEELNPKEFFDDAEKKAHDAKGVGKFTNVEVSAVLDMPMAESGLKVYDLKCSPCHKLTDEKLVGPGWKDVTTRRTPEWIMNFSTNTDEMLNTDPAAQAMLEECLVRMPNQSLSDEDALAVYEFMRKNDGVK
jgi:cytochrome c551/c552